MKVQNETVCQRCGKVLNNYTGMYNCEKCGVELCDDCIQIYEDVTYCMTCEHEEEY